MMNDIMFAVDHMGEYFRMGEYKVQVIGYDATEVGACVIVDHPFGWKIDCANSTDVIAVVGRTGKCMYAKWEDLK